MSIKFLDTNILLSHFDEVKNWEEKFWLSSKVLEELEEIKTSGRKDEQTRFEARRIVKWLSDNEDRYECAIVGCIESDLLFKSDLEVNNDNLIIATAKIFEDTTGDDVVFVTNDNLARIIARDIFGLKVEKLGCLQEDDYCGFKVLEKEEDIALFYETKENHFGLLNNEYLIINSPSKEDSEVYRWCGNKENFKQVSQLKGFSSRQLGDIFPKDFYQACAFDSLRSNQITKLGGCAGTGKSLISMTYLFQQLEKNKIDKIVVFCNMPKVRGSEELGWYKGTKDEKLLQSQIGNFLRTKLGSLEEVERLMGKYQQEGYNFSKKKGKDDSNRQVLEIYPICDIRGVDFNGQKVGIYITESQNMTTDLMKLCIQRAGSDSIMIIEGDEDTQLDGQVYEGKNNGLRRLSEVFRGEGVYGEVKLQTIYRSKLAEIAERM